MTRNLYTPIVTVTRKRELRVVVVGQSAVWVHHATGPVISVQEHDQREVLGTEVPVALGKEQNPANVGGDTRRQPFGVPVEKKSIS